MSVPGMEKTLKADKTAGFGNTPAVMVKKPSHGAADTDTTVGLLETSTAVDGLVKFVPSVVDSTS